MDKTDPYLVLELGHETLKTSVKNNAGGTNVIFDETMCFSKKLSDHVLTVKVYDKDTRRDDFLGNCEVDLNAITLPNGGETDVLSFVVVNKDKTAGKVLLVFSRKALPPGAFAGILHVTVHSIGNVCARVRL